MYILADSQSFYSVSSKIYPGAGTHTPGSPVSTQAVLDLIHPIIDTNKNITTDNYDISLSLAKELKSNKIILVGTIKKKNRCFLSSFMTKADAGTIKYAFDHANNFTLPSIASKKTKE